MACEEISANAKLFHDDDDDDGIKARVLFYSAMQLVALAATRRTVS